MQEKTGNQSWVKVCPLNELQEEDVRTVKINGEQVGVYRLEDGCFALHDVCTHAFAHLSDGFVEEGLVECPLHQARFDIRSGKSLDDIAEVDAETYEVRVEDGVVYVRG